jgi:hypothetical protein
MGRHYRDRKAKTKIVRFAVSIALAGAAIAIGTTQVAIAKSHGATLSGPNTAENGFTGPVELPSSSGLGEPSLAIDASGNLFATAPQGLGTVTTGGSPLYRSTDGGAGWQGPVRSLACTVLSGGDTDVVVDGGGNVWQTDLWLGNSCLSFSTDHGQSFEAGNPFGSEIQPGDDRPWIAYDHVSNQLFFTYDGLDAVHVAATAPLSPPEAGLQTVQDVPAVPECALGGNNPCNSNNIRQCLCPPGGIAVDNSTGARSGTVYVSYSRQNGGSSGGGVGIASSSPVLAGGLGAGINWTYSSVPKTGSTGSASDTEWNFDPTKVDSNGTLYVMWGEGINIDSNGIAQGGVAMKFAASNDGGQTWNGPFLISTTTSTNTFPTMDVVGPGQLQFAWYGAPGATGDPNTVSGSQTWNVYYASASGANAASPSISTPVVAIQNMHVGCIQTGGTASCGDRSLLDFFQLVTDHSGQPNIVYTAGDANHGVNLWFTKL